MERYVFVFRVDTKSIYLRGDNGELIKITMACIYTNLQAWKSMTGSDSCAASLVGSRELKVYQFKHSGDIHCLFKGKLVENEINFMHYRMHKLNLYFFR